MEWVSDAYRTTARLMEEVGLGTLPRYFIWAIWTIWKDWKDWGDNSKLNAEHLRAATEPASGGGHRFKPWLQPGNGMAV